jgi:hypothetical protein
MTGRHPTTEELDRFVSGEALPEELARIDQHVESCDACREALSDRVPVAALGFTRPLEGRAHLSFETLEALLLNQASASSDPAVREHLEGCDTCAKELEDLRVFESTRPRVFAAAAPPVVRSTLWERLQDRIRAISPGQLAWAGAAAAAVVVLMLLPREPDVPGSGSSASLPRPGVLTGADGLMTPERQARIVAIIEGRATATSEAVTLAELRPEDAELWAWAAIAYAGQPLLLGALAEDLGLLEEAEAAYQAALRTDPDSPDARRLLDALNARRQ